VKSPQITEIVNLPGWEGSLDPSSFGAGRAGGSGCHDTPTPAPLLGSSIVHISPQPCQTPRSFTVAKGGFYLQIHQHSVSNAAGGSKGGKRGKVKEFSRRSAARLRRTVYCIDQSKCDVPFFGAFTAPPGYLRWCDVALRMDRYGKRFRRRWGKDVPIIWKVEPHEGGGQKDGQPHFHVEIIWPKGTSPSLADFREWNDQAWFETVGSGNTNNRDYGCRVEVARSWEGVAGYTTKYFGKAYQCTSDHVGRCWGVINRAALKRELVDVECSPWVEKQVVRTLVRRQRRVREFYLWLDGDRWRRVREEPSTPGRKLGLSVQTQISHLAAAGKKIKRVRRRCLVKRSYHVWAEVETHTSFGVKKSMECIGDEVHCYALSEHYIRDGEVEKLIRFFEAQERMRAITLARIPF